jgi:nitrogen fixation protein NifU and related proteins
MDTPALYRDIVLDHHRAPRNYGALDTPTHAADGVNALCGDALRMELRLSEGLIAEYRFHGECCAITMAAASLLGQRVAGLDAAAVVALARQFDALLQGAEPAPELGELAAFSELARYPARRKCALLPWATLAAALAGEARATTERDKA